MGTIKVKNTDGSWIPVPIVANKILAGDVVQDSTHRFVTDTEKNKWDSNSGGGVGEAPTDGNQYTRGSRKWNKINIQDFALNMDLADKADKSELIAKQDKLIGTQIEGQNIKSINGESILGTGNITIEGGSGGGNVLPKAVIDELTLNFLISDIDTLYTIIKYDEKWGIVYKAKDDFYYRIDSDNNKTKLEGLNPQLHSYFYATTLQNAIEILGDNIYYFKSKSLEVYSLLTHTVIASININSPWYNNSVFTINGHLFVCAAKVGNGLKEIDVSNFTVKRELPEITFSKSYPFFCNTCFTRNNLIYSQNWIYDKNTNEFRKHITQALDSLGKEWTILPEYFVNAGAFLYAYNGVSFGEDGTITAFNSLKKLIVNAPVGENKFYYYDYYRFGESRIISLTDALSLKMFNTISHYSAHWNVMFSDIMFRKVFGNEYLFTLYQNGQVELKRI